MSVPHVRRMNAMARVEQAACSTDHHCMPMRVRACDPRVMVVMLSH
jgi:hypothetical protein